MAGLSDVRGDNDRWPADLFAGHAGHEELRWHSDGCTWPGAGGNARRYYMVRVVLWRPGRLLDRLQADQPLDRRTDDPGPVSAGHPNDWQVHEGIRHRSVFLVLRADTGSRNVHQAFD